MQKVDIKTLHLNPDNPRTISDAALARLTESVKNAPWLLDLRPLVVDKGGVVIGGNMRLKACLNAGMTEVPVVRAENLTEEQYREFVIKDNLPYGEWDWEALADETIWDRAELEDWGLKLPALDGDVGEDLSTGIENEKKFEVVVECDQESQQQTVYNLLKQKGYRCRVLTI